MDRSVLLQAEGLLQALNEDSRLDALRNARPQPSSDVVYLDHAARLLSERFGQAAWCFERDLLSAANSSALVARNSDTLLPRLPATLDSVVKLTELDEWLAQQGLPPDFSRPTVRMKRAMLVAQYANVWKSIERDLKASSSNGLGAEAKADGTGYWYVDKALKWARVKGRLSESSRIPSVFPTTTHKIDK